MLFKFKTFSMGGQEGLNVGGRTVVERGLAEESVEQ